MGRQSAPAVCWCVNHEFPGIVQIFNLKKNNEKERMKWSEKKTVIRARLIAANNDESVLWLSKAVVTWLIHNFCVLLVITFARSLFCLSNFFLAWYWIMKSGESFALHDVMTSRFGFIRMRQILLWNLLSIYQELCRVMRIRNVYSSLLLSAKVSKLCNSNFPLDFPSILPLNCASSLRLHQSSSDVALSQLYFIIVFFPFFSWMRVNNAG